MLIQVSSDWDQELKSGCKRVQGLKGLQYGVKKNGLSGNLGDE